ncbi:MAG: MFS transporter [Gemmataceae bacterium]|nr:MFS transporter [Gemmataceae bacterium]
MSSSSFSERPLGRPGPGASSPGPPPPQPLTATTWLILVIASIGFAFDIYELLMLPLILPPALQELLPHAPPGSPEFNLWRGLMFWVPAMVGGLFGLYGGYLTDRLGRRRVLTWSILLYACSAFGAGFSTSMPMLLVLRSLTFVGVCVEFVAAVAWLAELFPNPQQRERALGYTQAFSSIGGLMVAGAFLLANEIAPYLPAVLMPDFLAPSLGIISEGGSHAAWRYTLMSGLIPALPLILIRPFLPESPVWQRKKVMGTLRRPSFIDLFRPPFTRTTLVTTIMVALSYGAAFGAIQQVPQIVPGLPEVEQRVKDALDEPENQKRIAKALPRAREFFEKLRADEIIDEAGGQRTPDIDTAIENALRAESKAIERKARRRAEEIVVRRPIYNETAGRLQIMQEVGGLVGRFLLALLVVRIVSRRALIRLFQVPGLLIVPLVFAFAGVHNQVLFEVGGWEVTLLHVGIFVVALLTVGQFSFWGNYLPTVYPVHLRGTGESVAANIGGRMIGTSFAAVTSVLSGFIPAATDPLRMAYAAAIVGTLVYLGGVVASFFLPEPKEEMLHE